MLGRLVLEIERVPVLMRAKRNDEEKRMRAWRRQHVRRQRDMQIIQYSRKRADVVSRLAADLCKADQIRACIASVEDCESASARLVRQAKWAKFYTDHLDPLVDYRIEVLDLEPT